MIEVFLLDLVAGLLVRSIETDLFSGLGALHCNGGRATDNPTWV
jgi:hypothetical protein